MGCGPGEKVLQEVALSRQGTQGDRRLSQAAAGLQKPLRAALTMARNTGRAGRGAAGRGGNGVRAAGTGSECLKEFR